MILGESVLQNKEYPGKEAGGGAMYAELKEMTWFCLPLSPVVCWKAAFARAGCKLQK